MSDLIVFRARVVPHNPIRNFCKNTPITFPDGTTGVIRSILEVECLSSGEVYVVGKYRRNE